MHTSHSNSWFHAQPISFLLFSYEFYVLLLNRDVCVKEREVFSLHSIFLERLLWPMLCSIWTVVLEKTLESPLDCKELNTVNPKGNQPWIFTGAEAQILWLPDAKNWLRKDPDAGKDWRQEEKGTAEDEMVGWMAYWVDIPLSKLGELVVDRGVGDGQGNLGCCSPWCSKESDTTEWLELNWIILLLIITLFGNVYSGVLAS